MQSLATTLLAFAPVAAGLLVTRPVSDTAGLLAAMDNLTVTDIVAANGTYQLWTEPGLGDQNHSLVIKRDLTIRAAAGATVVLDGGKMKGVVYVGQGVAVWLQGLEITNGNAGDGHDGGGIFNEGLLTIKKCSVHHCIVTATRAPHGGGGGIFNALKGTLTIIGSEVRRAVVLRLLFTLPVSIPTSFSTTPPLHRSTITPPTRTAAASSMSGLSQSLGARSTKTPPVWRKAAASSMKPATSQSPAARRSTRTSRMGKAGASTLARMVKV
jgi:hypothetical protein